MKHLLLQSFPEKKKKIITVVNSVGDKSIHLPFNIWPHS